ncbi:MAG TPA: ABC transporter ATP-binding protein [Kiritimatiellia bacterium]|nr:ABC transporter ATP-binding protein [Kiritimatiellia bacterium]
MSIAISIENVSKSYRLGVYGRGTLREDLQSWWHRVRGLPDPNMRVDQAHLPVEGHTLWALQGITLEIQKGEILGIIGRNGAGKSTLLKILSRVTAPTSGRIRVKGRVASLLEVGTGFHPELTGRENAFLNGAILGMTRNEVARKFDEIVAFSELAPFIDTPVKRYSSGMYVRLAFAVAAHLEPEILVVDEVLAVGDAAFQKKCLGKMGAVARGGRTVLFVSHNMTAVTALCTQGLWLDDGRIRASGTTGDVVGKYLAMNAQVASRQVWGRAEAPGNEHIRVLRVEARPVRAEVIDIDSGIDLEVIYRNERKGRSIDVTCYVQNQLGILMFESGVVVAANSDSRAGTYRVTARIPPHLLNAGRYTCAFVFGEEQRHVMFRLDEAVCFDVANTSTGRGQNLGVAPGVIRPLLEWRAEPAGD